jgi:hypothetical protein
MIITIIMPIIHFIMIIITIMIIIMIILIIIAKPKTFQYSSKIRDPILYTHRHAVLNCRALTWGLSCMDIY